VSQVTSTQAETMLSTMVPAGFTKGKLEAHRDFAVVRGIPTIPTDNTLYLVRPSELVEANLWGNDVTPRRLANIRDLWRAGTRLPPLRLYWLADGRLVLDEGNHRVQIAAASDQMMAAEVVRNSGWTPAVGITPIADRVRQALPKTVFGDPTPDPDDREDTDPEAFRHNPAWVTEALAESWEIMGDSVQPAWLPKLDQIVMVGESHVAGRVKEFGCGRYGCVIPTADPSVVVKVTTDESEAHFAAYLSPGLSRPITVAYYQVLALNKSHEKRKLYILWRETAYQVGRLEQVLGARAEALVNAQHAAAQNAWRAQMGLEIPGEKGRPHDLMRRMLSRWVETCEAIARQTEVRELRELGDGLVELWGQQRLFFGDIHSGNLGIVHRSDGGHWVVTDPGYASVISDL
jgi:hypothetical protein